MKPRILVSLVAILLLAAAPSLALWEIATISRDDAKKMGIDVRSKPAGPDQVIVELEFKLAGQLKEVSGVELRSAKDDKWPSNPLPEDRSRPGRVIVSFTVDRTQLGKHILDIKVPGLDGGTIYELRLQDFVELKKEH